MLHVGVAKKFPQALDLESLEPFVRANKQGPCLTDSHRELIETTRDLYNFDLLAKLLALLRQILLSKTRSRGKVTIFVQMHRYINELALTLFTMAAVCGALELNMSAQLHSLVKSSQKSTSFH